MNRLLALTALFVFPWITPADKPNFIVINIDDLGYGDIEPFGCDHHKTPNLNRMAEEGRKLTCFYAAPVCSPSRASLMTGCYPKRALPIKHVFFPGQPGGLHPDEITIAELLKEQGYTTAIVGKWHLGDQPPFLPTRQGFDSYFGLPYSNDMGPAKDGVKSNLYAPIPTNRKSGQPPLPLMQDEKVVRRVLAEDQRQLVADYTEKAVEFLEQHQREPFFLYLPHSAVHFPLYPSKKFEGTSENGLFGDWTQEVDWSVGQVLDTVRRLGLAEKTFVLFTSDNGGAPRHGADNGPLRGGKGSTFEGGMRVPTIAWWPGKIPAGSECDEVMCTMDVMPTLVSLAGGSIPTDRVIDGADVWPLVSGRPEAKTPHETFLYFRGFELQAVRHGDFKLILKSKQLYNLRAEIGEETDVARQHPQVVAEIHAIAAAVDQDLGRQAIGPGCRTLGNVPNPKPLIPFDAE
jgi:arylsulfatase A